MEVTIAKYKEHADKKRRLKDFKIGELVLVQLGKGRAPKGSCSKL